MRATPKTEHLLVKRLEMADRLLKFVSDGDQWPEIVALLTELDEIDPDFDNTLQKLELTASLSEQIHGNVEIDLARDIGLLVVGLSNERIVVQAPEAGREFLGARFVSDNRGVGWVVINQGEAETKTPAYVISQKAAQHLPILPELKSGIHNKRLNELVVIHDFRMFEKTKDTLKDLYGLTDKEIKVCQYILAGENAAKLAVSMSVTRETVKSHLKNIFQKTNIRSQVELARILTQLASVTAILKFNAQGKGQAGLTLKQDYISLQSEVCKTRYGTDLYYSVCGDPKGRPMVFFHSPLGSRAHWHGMAMGAKRHGVQLYSFDRPGCGDSEAIPGYGPETVAACADDLLKTNGHVTADIIGFGIGGRVTMDAYTFMQSQIENIYLCSFYAPPIADKMQTQGVARQSALQKLNYHLRTNPHVISAMWKVMARIKSKPLIERAMTKAYRDVPADIRDMDNQEFRDFMVDTAMIAGRQDGRPQTFEFLNCKKPFTHKCQAYKNVKITAVFGAEDIYNSYARAQTFLSQFPQAHMIEAPDQGQFFALADFGGFLDALYS